MVIRPPGSTPMTPSRMECSSASRWSVRVAISAGSRPRVCFLIRRASRNEPVRPASEARPSRKATSGTSETSDDQALG
jgi:hypothetical protein